MILNNSYTTAHLAAFLTILCWGATFVSTKVLLQGFMPVQILLMRLCIGFAALYLLSFKGTYQLTRKQNLYVVAAGFLGICLYYLLENIALTYTQASNVGVIMSVSPFFTAIFSCFLLKEKLPSATCFIGFCLATAGIYLLSFSGGTIAINPKGDLLAISAAAVWALYSILMKEIGKLGFPTVFITRRIFGYGLLFMLPVLLFESDLNWQRMLEPIFFFNLLFLGLGASAMCFVTWNFAVKVLGPVKTSVYIYLVPVITVLCAVIVLHETISVHAALGILLTLIGLLLSELNSPKKIKL